MWKFQNSSRKHIPMSPPSVRYLRMETHENDALHNIMKQHCVLQIAVIQWVIIKAEDWWIIDNCKWKRLYERLATTIWSWFKESVMDQPGLSTITVRYLSFEELAATFLRTSGFRPVEKQATNLGTLDARRRSGKRRIFLLQLRFSLIVVSCIRSTSSRF